MSDPDQPPYTPYTPYTPPAEPTVEPVPVQPAYRPYDTREVPAAAAATSSRPSSVVPRLVGISVATIVLLGGLWIVGSANGPEDVETATGTISVDEDSVKGQLEEMRARYADARKADDLERVDLADTAFDRTAVDAFGYFLTDMIVAAGFGVDDDTAVEYARDAAEYERLLLAHQPLGDDIVITFSRHREFRYSGSTGQGGYVDPTKPGVSG